jgi:hypothetical protein
MLSCRYADCRVLLINMQNDIMLSVIILSVVMLSVIMLNVMAPIKLTSFLAFIFTVVAI